MNVKIRKYDMLGVRRNEIRGELQEVIISEDLMNPGNETISLCFRGRGTSGLVELRKDEAEAIIKRIEGRNKLVKGFEVIKSRPGGLL